jgi:hypothetical protein
VGAVSVSVGVTQWEGFGGEVVCGERD